MSTMILASDLKKTYKMGKGNVVEALRGATLKIEKGEMAAIVGPSGSGKSTLMHMLGCLDKADSGSVKLDDKEVVGLSSKQLTEMRRGEIGFIFQRFNLVPTLSAQENVAIAAEYAGKSRRESATLARAALDKVGLSDRLRHRPSELSGGEQQRVAVARAIVNNPKIILGDEPTGNLDTETSERIMTLLRKINQENQTTFVLVTHNPELAQACDRVIRFRDGRVAE